MKIRDIAMCLMGLIMFSGCNYFTPTYEIFAGNMDANMRNWTPTEYIIKNHREIYDENRYVYISEYPKGCIVGYLTNRDDKPEVVQEWIILSGKENCKITESFVLIQ